MIPLWFKLIQSLVDAGENHSAGGTRHQVSTTQQRRICWPEPDATCVEGGCSWCNDSPRRSVESIRRYCEKAGTLENRYGGTSQDAMLAFRYGESRDWNNAQTRERS